jgi:hypothetical protein
MPLAGTAALLNWSDVAEVDRPEYYAWHVREHMIGRIGVLGFLRARRYAAVRAANPFFQFYELADAAVLESAPYRALAGAPTKLTQRVTQRIVNSCRVVATQMLSVGAGQAGYLLTLRLLSDDADAVVFDAGMTRAMALRLSATPMITSVSVFAAVDRPSRIALVEGLSVAALEDASEALKMVLQGVTHDIAHDLFHHEFTVTPDDAHLE